MIHPEPDLTPANIDKLNVFSNQYDVRHDVHAYVEYVREREVKRSHRSNSLSSSDAKRLAKLMSFSSALEEVTTSGYSDWINYIDKLALLFKFVRYDTKGTYAGYSSREPSYPDNYIKVDTKTYEDFIDLPLIEQEKKLLELLVQNYIDGDNEFFNTSVIGSLLPFSGWGSATGVIPGLDFASARRFLIEILTSCKAGVWYTTSSLIQYLKEHHPFFLIPQHPKYRYEWDAKNGRYGNFRERKEKGGQEMQIAEFDVDAFERVEGRYVERFLEGLPLILGYIEVAYSRKEDRACMPEMGQLVAFCVNNTFLRVMRGEIIQPRVIVQPNFEVHVDSELYPVRLLSQLIKFSDVVSENRTCILKLQKKKVLTQLSQREDVDVINLLENITGQELPQNVRIELEEWIGVLEAFTLYEHTALLEGDEHLPDIDQFTIERISPGMRIVHSPDTLFMHLEQKELIPLHIKHSSSALTPLPGGARTVFPRHEPRVSKSRERSKNPVTIKREVQITFHFPVKELMEEFRKGLIAARCPVAVDWSKLTLSFARQYESEVKKVSKALNQDYTIHFEDIA